MKIQLFLITLLVSCSCLAEVRPAATKESLMAMKKELANSQKGHPIQPVAKEVLVQPDTGRSILDSSSYLVGALGYTLIPNGSALCVGKAFTLTTTKPENLAYMDWISFVRSHRNGLQLLPVQEKQLQPHSNNQIVRTRVASFKKMGVTCVTTFNRQPVRIPQSPTPSKL